MYNTLNRSLKYFYKIKFTDNSLVVVVRSRVEIFYKIDSLIDIALLKN